MTATTTLQHLNQESNITQPTNEITLPPTQAKDDLQDAAVLLDQFNATSLGEGNLTAGFNTLAVMALTIANLSPPGSCLVDSDESTRIPVGMNVLVNGALSCGIVKDRVLAVIESQQNNLYRHIRLQMVRAKKRESRISETSAFLGKEEEREAPTLLDRLKKGAHFNEVEFEAQLRSILHPPSNPGVDEITDTPVVFAGIGSVEGLTAAMSCAHRGRLFIHTTLSGKNGATLFAQACGELVSGCPKSKKLGVSVRGEVIATDPTGSLDVLLAKGAGRDYLERLLWLSDHAAGPEIEITDSIKEEPRLDQVGACFDAALEEMVVKRFNFHKPIPEIFEYPYARSQADWNAFLARYESSFPGIAGTLRPLWASLLFGLLMIVRAAPKNNRPQLHVARVDAFARLLVMRMVNAREVILDDARRKLLEKLATNFRIKLMDGPHSVRDFQRKGNKLDASTCCEVLERLADSGLVVRRGSLWHLVNHVRSKTHNTVDV
jgi:hypothetical protein